jgi:hypothetical protein
LDFESPCSRLCVASVVSNSAWVAVNYPVAAGVDPLCRLAAVVAVVVAVGAAVGHGSTSCRPARLAAHLVDPSFVGTAETGNEAPHGWAWDHRLGIDPWPYCLAVAGHQVHSVVAAHTDPGTDRAEASNCLVNTVAIVADKEASTVNRVAHHPVPFCSHACEAVAAVDNCPELPYCWAVLPVVEIAAEDFVVGAEVAAAVVVVTSVVGWVSTKPMAVGRAMQHWCPTTLVAAAVVDYYALNYYYYYLFAVVVVAVDAAAAAAAADSGPGNDYSMDVEASEYFVDLRLRT